MKVKEILKNISADDAKVCYIDSSNTKHFFWLSDWRNGAESWCNDMEVSIDFKTYYDIVLVDNEDE